HIKGGGDALSWIVPAIERFTHAGTLAALTGYVLAAWAIGFVISTVVDAGIWGTLTASFRNEEVRGLRTVFANATRGWGSAVGARVVTLGADAMLVAMFVGTLVSLSTLVAAVGRLTTSTVVA